MLSSREHLRAKNADETPPRSALDNRKHFALVNEKAGPLSCGKIRRLKSAWALLERPALSTPCGQTAIQHGNLIVTKGLEQSPESRGPNAGRVVVDDDLTPVCESDRASSRSKTSSRRPREGERRLWIGKVGDEIGEAGAHDVSRFKGRTVAEPYVVDLRSRRQQQCPDVRGAPGAASLKRGPGAYGTPERSRTGTSLNTTLAD